MVKIKWLAHASFLIEGEGLRIITDPYEPNEIINLPPITETADIVVRSSDDDEAHAFIDTIPAGYELVTATDIVDSGTTVKGIDFSAIWAEENYKKEIVRDNAMYRFTLDGVHFTHMGDVGNPLSDEQMAALKGTDVLLALTGGYPTIALPDLKAVIDAIRPKIVIPMHYKIPGPRFPMLQVTDFTAHFEEQDVDWLESTEIEVSPETLPDETRVVVLQPTLFRVE